MRDLDAKAWLVASLCFTCGIVVGAVGVIASVGLLIGWGAWTVFGG